MAAEKSDGEAMPVSDAKDRERSWKGIMKPRPVCSDLSFFQQRDTENMVLKGEALV